jgi:tetratricopeptide (TPR) repeat protein
MKRAQKEVVAALLAAALAVAIGGAADTFEEATRLYVKGVELGVQAKFSQAKAAFDQALQVEPHFDPAKKCLRLLAQIQAGTITSKTASHIFKAAAYGTEGKLDQAIWELDLALQVAPGLAVAYNNRGYFYYEKGNFDRAIADYNQALQINPRYAGAFCNRGVAYAFKGYPKEAMSDYNRALELNPRDAFTYNNRGNLYMATGDLERAIADYSRALQINPRYAEAYNNRGGCYGMKGDLERSIADLSRALEINPNYPMAWFNKGLSCERAGRKLEAREAYQNFVRYAPHQYSAKILHAQERIRALSK